MKEQSLWRKRSIIKTGTRKVIKILHFTVSWLHENILVSELFSSQMVPLVSDVDIGRIIRLQKLYQMASACQSTISVGRKNKNNSSLNHFYFSIAFA